MKKKAIISVVIIVFLFIFTFFLSCKAPNDSMIEDDSKVPTLEDGSEYDPLDHWIDGLPDIDADYSVEVYNNVIVSGLDDLEEFYLLTKEEHKKLSLLITNKIDAYYKKEVLKDFDISEVAYSMIVYNGNRYLFYTEEGLQTNYKYLNYSRTIISGNYKVGYVLADNPDLDLGTYFSALVSSDINTAEKIFHGIVVLSGGVCNNLSFMPSELLSVTYTSCGVERDYYPNMTSRTVLLKVLDGLKWQKEEIKGDGSNKISVSMNRRLLLDKDDLIEKEERHHDFYQIDYEFYLNSNVVSMKYTFNNNTYTLYATIEDSDIDLIKNLVSENYEIKIRIGTYTKYVPTNKEYIIVGIELKDNNEVVFFAYQKDSGEEVILGEGTYEIDVEILTLRLKDINGRDLVLVFELQKKNQVRSLLLIKDSSINLDSKYDVLRVGDVLVMDFDLTYYYLFLGGL